MIVGYQPQAGPGTVAELLASLGGVPAERVLTKPAPGTATEADVDDARRRGRLCELIDGTLVEKAMGSLSSLLALELGRLLGNFNAEHRLGVLTGADGFLKFRPDLLRAPDLTFIPWSAFPNGELPTDAYWSVKPALVVEVLSPNNTKPEIDRKLGEMFAAGCKLAWVIDPATKTARVHTSAARSRPLDESGTLDGGKVLPGFKIALADLFAAATPPARKKRR